MAAQERSYELFVPNDLSQPAPLLIVLHGAGGSGARIQRWLGLDALAESAGMIVVYPDGLEHAWDFGGGIPTADGRIEVDDVGFLVGLVDDLADQYAIDRTRVFAAGMSNGGLMAYRLACAAPDTFAAIAVVAAPLYYHAALECSEKPVSVLYIHGTADPILPWERNTIASGRPISLSAIETFTFWAQHNDCDQDALVSDMLPDVVEDDNSQVSHLALIDCAAGTEVQFYGIVGGGHTWPGHAFDIEMALGPLNMDIDASAVIVNWLLSLGQ